MLRRGENKRISVRTTASTDKSVANVNSLSLAGIDMQPLDI